MSVFTPVPKEGNAALGEGLIEFCCVVLQKYTLSYRFQWVFSLFCTGMSSPRALKVDTAAALSEDSKKWYSRQLPSA